MNAQVTAIKHKDVRGKELLYLKIETGNGECLVNIGEKTYNQIEAITQIKTNGNTMDNKAKVR